MARLQVAICVLALVCPTLTIHDDDFAFDNSDEFQVELTANHSEIAKHGLKRLWGVPDATAYVGHLFRMEIPKEAFSGAVHSYRIVRESGRRLPIWLAADTRHGLLSGVPQPNDVGEHKLAVTALGPAPALSAFDTFTIRVKKSEEKPQSKYGTCGYSQNRLVLTILLDTPFSRIPPRHRIRSLMELATFMALDGSEFSIEPYKAESAKDHTVLMSGPGSVTRRKGDATTAIYLNVGCGDKLWPRHKVLVSGLREQSRDGTIAHLMKLPVLGWRLLSVKPAPRHKRQLPVEEGSGGFDYEHEDDGDYSGYGDDEDDDYDRADDFGPVPEIVNPNPPEGHPHRHHHGEEQTTFQTDDSTETTHTATTTTEPTTTNKPTTSTTTKPTTPTTPKPTTPTIPTTEEATTATIENTTPELESTTNAYTTEDDNVKIEPYPESASEASNVNYSHVAPPTSGRKFSPVSITPETEPTITTEADTQTVIIRASNEIPSSSTEMIPSFASPSPPPPTEMTLPTTVSTTSTTTSTTLRTTSTTSRTTSTTSTTPTVLITTPTTIPTTMATPTSVIIPDPELTDVTEQSVPLSTDMSSTIIGRTTETFVFAPPVTVPAPVNQPPTLKHHMKKLAITAGKAFRYIIPSNLFTDAEDGTNLTFTMYEAENVPLKQNSWVQFIPEEREVYGLPLEEHVSRWNFIVEAKDSEGLVAKGPLDITVQQHKSGRNINHEFILPLKLNKPYKYSIDWQIRALEGIVNLFRDTDMDHLTVLNATQNGDNCELVWTNDTLPKDSTCPKEDINRLMKILSSGPNPSPALLRAMQPQLTAGSPTWRGRGACPVREASPPDTFPPWPRNQVDHVTASVGQLLVYTVPEDTFYDPEDGDTRHLKLSLRRGDRGEIARDHWLQFDENNQEFYGLPGDSDVGSFQYQLVAKDSKMNTASDSLVVDVVRAPAIRPTVEFQMTLDCPYSMLARDATNKRRLVEKIAALFGDQSTASIRIQNITDNPTTIIWYNTSLPMDRCPEKEIGELRKMIILDERTLKENVDQIFDKDYKVMSMRLVMLGLCAEQNTKTPKNVPPVMGTNNNLHNRAGTAEGNYTEYLVTFIIPAVVIVCMILLASIVACVLYRRRRTGKMSVGDEEERQAFRSKGIPVIFQDELEEQSATEPLHKSPVIMREEKPPLLPPAPDYRSSAPYRPPPPVAPATTPPRPKATPTYRKPPPYVPP